MQDGKVTLIFHRTNRHVWYETPVTRDAVNVLIVKLTKITFIKFNLIVDKEQE